ncbi:MAG: phage head closure protein [Pseudomonadota bacterium]
MIIKPLMTNAGDLKMPFRHQSPSIANDSHGSPQTSWVDRGVAWGAFERASATTEVRAQSDEAERTALILVRHRMANPCQAGDRLVGATTWQINAVADPDGTERFQRLYCTTENGGVSG